MRDSARNKPLTMKNSKRQGRLHGEKDKSYIFSLWLNYLIDIEEEKAKNDI